MGGGEVLANSLRRALPKSKIQTCYVNTSHFQIKKNENLIGFLQLPIKLPNYIIKLFCPIYFYLVRSRKYDLVIHSGTMSLFAAGMGRASIFYCHKPPLFKREEISKVSPLRFLYPIINKFIERRLKSMDLILSNSKFTADRLTQETGLKSQILHPCVDFSLLDNKRSNCIPVNPYYVSTSRHAKHKNVDKIIRAFRRLPQHKLIICSSGAETNKLKKLARNYPNIKFSGHLRRSEYFDTVANATAAIYVPTNEDFGISALEALALGAPLIHTNSGGLIELCSNQRTFHIRGENVEEELCELLSLPFKIEKNISSLDLIKDDFGPSNFKRKLQNFVKGFI